MKFKYLILMAFLCLNLNLFSQVVEKYIPHEEITLELKPEDSEQAFDAFVEAIKAEGFKVSEKSSKRKMGKLNRFDLTLKHQQGLNFKIKARGFSAFELKIYKDKKGNLAHFATRFNKKGNFTKPISLESHGRSSYSFKGNSSSSSTSLYY